MTRRQLLAVATLCALALAGCVGAPADAPADELDIEYQVENRANEPYRVTLSVAPDPLDGVRVTFPNGSARTYDVERIEALPAATLGRATDLEPLGENVQRRTLTVDARSGFGGTFESVTEEVVVLYTVRGTGGDVAFRGWGGVTCSRSVEVLRVEIVANPDGSFDAGVACTG